MHFIDTMCYINITIDSFQIFRDIHIHINKEVTHPYVNYLQTLC